MREEEEEESGDISCLWQVASKRLGIQHHVACRDFMLEPR